MKIAVTYEDGKIFPHFGHTQAFKLYDAEDGKVISSRVVPTDGCGHGALAAFLREQGAEILICGGIGGGARTALDEAGIRLYGGASGDADAAVEALLYLTGKESSEEMYYGIGTFPTNKESLSSIAELSSGPSKVLVDSLNANEYTRPKQVKYPQLRQAFSNILTYMRNQEYYGSDYNLAEYVAEQASDVDADQIAG